MIRGMTKQLDLFRQPVVPLPPHDRSHGLLVQTPCACRCGAALAVIGPGKGPHAAALHCEECDVHRGWVSHATHQFLIELIKQIRPADRADCHSRRRSGSGLMSPKPAQLRPTFLLTLQPARGRDGIHGLRALLKIALRKFGLRAIAVREMPAKRAKLSPKFVPKTDEPPPLSRRQMLCIRKDSQMKKDDVFPSKYLKHTDLHGKPTTTTVERAVLETLKSPEGKTQDKIILYFAGAKKSLPLNVTNFDAVAGICGDDTDNWSGCQIELYPSKMQMAGKTVDCIRVRAPTKPIKKAAAKSGGGGFEG
jgi:hypothetical protein